MKNLMSLARRCWSMAGKVAVMAAVGAVAVTVAPSPASASTPGQFLTHWQLENHQTHLCLDGDGGRIWTTGDCPSFNTYFAVYTTPWDGFYNLQDPQTGLCLDGGGRVLETPCNWNNEYQAWYPGGQGPATTFGNKATGRCLDSNFNNEAYTNPCDWNNVYQNWFIRQA